MLDAVPYLSSPAGELTEFAHQPSYVRCFFEALERSRQAWEAMERSRQARVDR